MPISAPYRFVPLSNLIVFPDWADQVSHVMPFKEGLCGHLDVQLTNLTPLCAGNDKKKAEDNIGLVQCFRNGDNKLAIHSKNLTGMLKNVLKIASFSRFSDVEDQQLSVRDLTSSRNFYMKDMRNAKSGWLNYDASKNQWVIYPCDMKKVHQQYIIHDADINYSDWTRSQDFSSIEKYKMVMRKKGVENIFPDIYFKDIDVDIDGELVQKTSLFKFDENDSNLQKGHLVMTGQVGGFYNRNTPFAYRNKKYEFIFFNKETDKHEINKKDTMPLDVTAHVMTAFSQVHRASKEWQFWSANLKKLPNGIPVFFHTKGSDVKSLGLACMYKLAYKNTLHDAIKNTNADHVSKDAREDLAELLVGFSDAEKTTSSGLKGRIDVGMAEIICSDGDTRNQNAITFETKPTILSEPKPAFYPFYIRQKAGNNEYNQLMNDNVTLAGWKSYQIKQEYAIHELTGKSKDSKNAQTRLEAIHNGNTFAFSIKFHNLLPVELGALLWAIDFGGRDTCYHSIGMGKPFGMGAVQLTIQDSELTRNDFSIIEHAEDYLNGCRQEFINFMNHAFELNGIDGLWEDCDTIKALVAYATPEEKDGLFKYLGTPKAYSEIKKSKHLDNVATEFHSYQPSNVQVPANIISVPHNTNIMQSIDDFKVISKARAQALIEKEQARLEAERLEEQDRLEAERLEEQARLEQEALKKRLEDATEEEQALIHIQEYIKKLKTLDTISKTEKNRAHKVLKEPYDSFKDSFSAEQKNELKSLADELHKLIGTKRQLDNIIRKINAL